MQKPDLTCWQGWETNPRPAELVSQADCTAAPTVLALWATEAGTDSVIFAEIPDKESDSALFDVVTNPARTLLSPK